MPLTSPPKEKQKKPKSRDTERDRGKEKFYIEAEFSSFYDRQSSSKFELGCTVGMSFQGFAVILTDVGIRMALHPQDEAAALLMSGGVPKHEAERRSREDLHVCHVTNFLTQN